MKKKIKNILKYILTYSTIAIIGTITFFTCLCANVSADIVDYQLINEGYANTLYLNNTNVIGTSERINYINNNGTQLIDTQTTNQNVNHLIINYNIEKTINQNMKILLKNYSTTTRINFLTQNNGIQYYILTTETPYEINGNMAQFSITEEIKFYKIEIFNINISSSDAPQFTIINANERAYNKGYTDAMQKYDALNNQYQTLEQNYNNLQQQYNELATNEYTFENLFWSVGSVPMAFLMQSFNVNVLGLNMAAIITGLITALVVIWAIKKLLK